MWNTFLDWFSFIVDKIKNWKDVWRTLFILLIVFALNIITKEYTERLVINSKTEVVNEINQRHDSILNHVIEKSPEVDRVINSILDNLNIILNSEIGTRINKVVERIGCSMLLYSSKKDVKSLREYMYNDATIYLKRKYDSCYKIYVNTERDWITIPCNA